MSQVRAKILENIRKHTLHQENHPDLASFIAIHYEDKVAQFIKMTEAVGGRVVQLSDDSNIGEIVRGLYPEATRFISNLDLEGILCINPQEAHSAIEMNGTDVTIVVSPLGVCENACVWVEQTEEWRAQFFIAENLVLILDRNDLVHNMHEGYARVKEFNPQTPFSGFISGPSKTADIEQALVMGAHGARGLTVLLR